MPPSSDSMDFSHIPDPCLVERVANSNIVRVAGRTRVRSRRFKVRPPSFTNLAVVLLELNNRERGNFYLNISENVLFIYTSKNLHLGR